MKNLIAVFLAVMLFSSCDSITGNGNIKTETRNVKNFSGVKTSGSIDVEITRGDKYSVSVENDENILPEVITEVEGGTLNIHYKSNTFITNDHAKVYVTAPSLDKVITSGSANITINGIIKNDRQIEVGVSGSGNIEGGLDAPEISASVGGSGNINLHGRTKDFDARVSGSGNMDCKDLQSENTTIKVSGSGNAHVFASVHLEASVSGSGDIYYGGNPNSPEIHTSGSGSVKPE